VVESLSTRLEGRIVVLEPLRPEHAELLWPVACDPEVWRWMIVRADRSEAVFRGWIEEALTRAGEAREAPFAVLSAETGEPLGSTRYTALRPEHRGVEVGYTWLAREAWGTGANSESKLLLLEHAFARAGCIRVEFKTDARNERARRALEALPARFEGIFRKHMVVRDGELRDSAWYAITDDEWPAVRENLERRLESRR
jgi:RimJ/RimL family protein N-acetyltransferase